MRLRVRHRTTYRYVRPVRLLEHRLLVTPRSRHDVVTVASEVRVSPVAELVWSEDAAGNSAALALFTGPTSELTILAEHEVLHAAEPYPIFRLDPAAHRHPFSYAPGDRALFGPGVLSAAPDDAPDLVSWVDAFRREVPDDTLTLLKALNEAVGAAVAYRTRDEEGTQSPSRTLELRSGSCRDLAALFLAAARRLGFAARAVSGYLYDPGSVAGDAGATHAWCEVFLPGAGWIAFDPTQRRVGSAGLIGVAVGASSDAVLPVVGGFLGEAADFAGMDVSVSVVALDAHGQD